MGSKASHYFSVQTVNMPYILQLWYLYCILRMTNDWSVYAVSYTHLDVYKRQGTKIKRQHVSGFRARMATPGGQEVLNRRRAKGRHQIAVTGDVYKRQS